VNTYRDLNRDLPAISEPSIVDTLTSLGPQRWRRGEARFDKRARTIEVDRARSEVYDVPAGPQVALDLARIRRPEDAIAFVGAWGLLDTPPDAPLLAEKWESWATRSEALRTLLALVTASRQALEGDAAALALLRGWWPLGGPGVPEAYGPEAAADDAFLDQVAVRLASILNVGMGYTYEFVEPSPWRRGEWILTAVSPTLSGRAYRETAAMVVGYKELRRCAAEDCRAFFIPDDPRQRYCSARCNNRVRQRKRTGGRPRHPIVEGNLMSAIAPDKERAS
jgi:hypothetical protein